MIMRGVKHFVACTPTDLPRVPLLVSVQGCQVTEEMVMMPNGVARPSVVVRYETQIGNVEFVYDARAFMNTVAALEQACENLTIMEHS